MLGSEKSRSSQAVRPPVPCHFDFHGDPRSVLYIAYVARLRAAVENMCTAAGIVGASEVLFSGKPPEVAKPTTEATEKGRWGGGGGLVSSLPILTKTVLFRLA